MLEAGEEEFLEIMALVGMASKPLHVRRLQKALQEYSTNPVAFQMLAFQKSGVTPPPGLALAAASLPQLLGAPFTSSSVTPSMVSPLLPYTTNGVASGSYGSGSNLHNSMAMTAAGSESPDALSTHSNSSIANMWVHSLPDGLDANAEGYVLPSTSPPLTDDQIRRIAECASILAATLPEYEPKLMQNKKKISRELLHAMETQDANLRLQQFRKYARIYGRFDAKRKADKPLTLHEVSVNEAAAQICMHRPALLTRRDELFPLARQVVRDAGYQYMKISSDFIRSSPPESICSDFNGSPAPSTSTASELSPEGLQLMVEPSDRNRRHHSFSVMTALSKKRRCLKDISDEMQKISHEQDMCKMRVAEANDLVELHAIQRDLQRLTQRQMELSDEQAEALRNLKNEPSKGCFDTFNLAPRLNSMGHHNNNNSSVYPKMENCGLVKLEQEAAAESPSGGGNRSS